MIPVYMVVNKLHLVDTIWSLVLPGAIPIFSAILLMNFFLGIPKSQEEAAVIDGAADYEEEMNALLHALHERNKRQCRVLCEYPTPVVFQYEDTSTTVDEHLYADRI